MISRRITIPLLVPILLLGLMFLPAKDSLGRSPNSTEESLFKIYQMKALFLYNFANFVEWPNEAFPNENSKLKMCLFGTVPFGIFLDFVNGTVIRDRRLVVIQTNLLADIESGCHILFVGQDQRQRLPQFFREIKHSYVLSVGDVKEFTLEGGVISIMRTIDQMEFEINLYQAIANGLFIHSDLLSLARVVRRKQTSADNN